MVQAMFASVDMQAFHLLSCAKGEMERRVLHRRKQRGTPRAEGKAGYTSKGKAGGL